jgi:Ca2+-binding RTX toxin-like protein
MALLWGKPSSQPCGENTSKSIKQESLTQMGVVAPFPTASLTPFEQQGKNMATVSINNAWGWSYDKPWFGWYSYKNNTDPYVAKDEFWISDGYRTVALFGSSLTYKKASGDNNYLTGGTVNSIFVGRMEDQYYFTDISIKATTLNSYLQANTAASNINLYKALFAGDDDITLSFGADKVASFGGDDVIRGRAGNDTIDAGSGDDVLYGGTGKDFLKGGTGADFFVFDTKPNASNVDTIDDFSVKDDMIVLDHLIYRNIGTAGSRSSELFRVNTTGKAGDGSDRIIYNSKTGALNYDPDGTGSKVAVQIAVLDAGLKLTIADFDII